MTIRQRGITDGEIKTLTELLRLARKNAAQRGIPYESTPNEFFEICQESEGCCQVTGIPFELGSAVNGERRPWFPSLDRKDSGLGYTRANCRLVCVAANMAMNEWGEHVLVRMAMAISRKNWRDRYRQKRRIFQKAGKLPEFSNFTATEIT